MAAPPPLSLTLLNTLVTALQDIVASTSWLTVPSVAYGVPNDTIGPLKSPKLFVNLNRIEQDPSMSGTRHYWKATVDVYCAARDLGTCLALHADAVRAIYGREALFTQTFGQPCWPESFSIREDMTAASNLVGVLTVTQCYNTDHSAS